MFIASPNFGTTERDIYTVSFSVSIKWINVDQRVDNKDPLEEC